MVAGQVPVAQCPSSYFGEVGDEGVVEDRRELDEMAVGVNDRMPEPPSSRSDGRPAPPRACARSGRPRYSGGSDRPRKLMCMNGAGIVVPRDSAAATRCAN